MCNIKRVIKRDGSIELFNSEKIKEALKAAFIEVDGMVTRQTELLIESIIYDLKENVLYDSMHIELIQDEIEKELMNSNRLDVAKAYILYREHRTQEREKENKYKELVKRRVNVTVNENSNANVDEASFSGREKEAAADIFKQVNQEELPRFLTQAHEEMLIYQHDYEKAMFGVHNCLNINFPRLLKYGFTTRNCPVRPARSFSTACQLVAVIFQLQSQNQFGGCGSIHLDYDLAPYVKMSFVKQYVKAIVRNSEDFMELNLMEMDDKELEEWVDKNVDKYLSKEGIVKEQITLDQRGTLNPIYYQQALYELKLEMKQSCEALFHNLGTLESRQGSQVPFTSINYGRDTSTEGRMVTQYLLKASINGIGKHHLTPIFPISIFQCKQGVNMNPGDPNYDLKQLALISMSMRIYPNFVNGDWSEAHEDPDDIDTFMSTMGCRTMISYDRHGLGYIRQGRGNNVPNTIILPKLGIDYGICLGKRDKADLKGFWKALDETLRLTEKTLLVRYNLMIKQSPKAAPFMYNNGTIAGADDCKATVENALKHGSLAIGILGMAEMCTALFGKNHAEDKEVHKFALEVVRHINQFAKEASERNDLNFGLYYTPAEGLCHKAVKELRKQYGTIPGVTDREYLTNSIHVPVWMDVTIKEKLDIESPFTKYGTSGCITYLEVSSMFVKNIKAIEDVLDYAMKVDDIPYLAFNFPIDTCLDCGHQGEFNDCCPVCGSKHIQQLRRVTGYLSSDYHNFNYGKEKETEERHRHDGSQK